MTVDFDPMTFIYELVQYSLEINWISENGFPISGLSKGIVLQKDRQTDRQTRPKLYTMPLCGLSMDE